ncbi:MULTISPECIES: hypothetical protein [unclassified Streptomyces]|uniref:hypothetical protein n=1 Tax=unclassified Streptomyces TaxID=2593676 RepID=UPI0036565171
MTQHTVHGTLTEEIARAVQNVPGVAFLKPGLATRVRSALARSQPKTAAERTAGVRLAGPGGTGPWRVEVHLVARRRARTVDVARAARRTVLDHLAVRCPEEAVRAHVTVTVTGLV